MDSEHSSGALTRTPELPAPSTGIARQSVQLPRNWVEMIERWKEGTVREVIMDAIAMYVMVLAAQVREEKAVDGGSIPVLTRSQTGNELMQYAKLRNVPPAALVRVGASIVVKLLTERVGEETLFDRIAKSAEASKRKFVDEVVRLLEKGLQGRS